MTIGWTAPWALWLLAAVPALWLGLRAGRTNFNPRQKMLQAAIRSVTLVALALALARPVVSWGSSAVSVVYVVDISHSIASRAIETAADAIDRLNTEVRPAHWRIVAFGLEAAGVPDTAALRALARVDAETAVATASHREGTDLERALAEARAELAPGHVPRIVLFSDGRETVGDVRVAAARLIADGIPVFVEPLDVREVGDAWVDRIQVAQPAAPGALTAVQVTVGSQRAASARLDVREGSSVLASRTVTLTRGLTSVALDVTFDRAGARVIEAVLALAPDPLSANNRLATEVVVGAKARVLYVEGAPDHARFLRTALEQSGFQVTAGGSALLPRTRGALADWDVLILSDVARRLIPDETMTAIAAWVEQDGGGLLVAGGDAVFGEGAPDGPGGYRRTELERLTPVTFERKDEPEVALIIVLDKSWSMAGQQMELCKTAAQAAIDVLADEQSVGVVTFNDELKWDVTLRNVGEHREMIRKAIAAIEPSGHTLIYPALEQAYLALKEARARAKHVVLLSDGRSYPDDYEGLARKMVDAKMTVSSIAVGAAADIELLTNIAKWGKGRSYVVADAREVPQIFVKEAKDAVAPAFDEKAVVPVLKARAFLETVDMTKAPNLRGRTATVLKDGALELLSTKDGDPLLAFWPVGLGRSAVFASDVKDRWAADWLKWRGYGPFFASVVHALERRPAPPAAIEIAAGPARGTTREVTVTVEARDDEGGYALLPRLPALQVRSSAGSTATMPTRQIAPGAYAATFVAGATEALTVSLDGEPAGTAARFLVPDPDLEYRLRPVDDETLRALATSTGGAWGASADAMRRAAVAPRIARHAAWPWLVALALALWIIDVLFRRVRVFERPAT